jgi:hypothetical protein
METFGKGIKAFSGKLVEAYGFEQQGGQALP